MNKFILSICLVLSLAACSKSSANDPQGENRPNNLAQAATQSAPQAQALTPTQQAKELFKECGNKYYPKEMKEKYYACVIEKYENAPQEVQDEVSNFQLDDVLEGYWRNGEGLKVYALLKERNPFFLDDEEIDNDGPAPTEKELAQKMEKGEMTLKDTIYVINLLREESAKNEGQAQLVLADIYEEDRYKLHIPNGCELAYEELQKSVQNGYVPAMYRLANFYVDEGMGACGYDLDYDEFFDSQKAVELYTKAANLGEENAQLMLGEVYSMGPDFLGQPQNPKLAFEWYSKAAQNNSTEALYALISAYYNGMGTAVNYQKAFAIARRIQADEPGALVWLGKMYFYGNGTKQNYKKAFEVLTKWMELKGKPFMDRYNFDNANYLLGKMYQNGWGTKQNLEKAKEHFKAIGKEYLFATDETYPVEFLLRNAVENNNKLAQKALEGKTLSQEAQALLTTAQAAYAGDAEAMYQLGLLYNKLEKWVLFYPKEVKGNETSCKGDFVTEAYKWIKKAAEQGHTEAQVMLAKAYETGIVSNGTAWWYGYCITDPIVISKDEKLAQHWHQKAGR